MAKSWSWSVVLTRVVNHQGSVDVPTPDYDGTLVDESTVELAVGNDVVAVPDDATVTFNGEDATVVNKTGDAWETGASVYIYVEGKDAGDVDGSTLTAMQADIAANTSDIAANTSDIASNTSAIADLETRLAAIEGAANAARSVPLAVPVAKGK